MPYSRKSRAGTWSHSALPRYSVLPAKNKRLCTKSNGFLHLKYVKSAGDFPGQPGKPQGVRLRVHQTFEMAVAGPGLKDEQLIALLAPYQRGNRSEDQVQVPLLLRLSIFE